MGPTGIKQVASGRPPRLSGRFSPRGASAGIPSRAFRLQPPRSLWQGSASPARAPWSLWPGGASRAGAPDPLTAEAVRRRGAARSRPHRRGRADLAHLHPALWLPPISPKPLLVAEGAGGLPAGSPGAGRRGAPLLPAPGDSHQTLGAFVPAAVRARGSLRPWSPGGRANYSSACPRPPRL